jgi:hypothetical protein
MDEILAQLFPQAPSYFPGLLGQEQANLLQQQAQRQGLLGIGMGLLQAAAPSTTRPSLGAGIAQGLSAGQQMAKNVYAQKLQEQLVGQKLLEQQRLMREQEVARTLLPQILTPGQQVPTFYGQPTTFPQRDDEGTVLPGAGVQTGQPQLNLNTLQAVLTQAPGAAAQILPIVEAYRKLSAPEEIKLGAEERLFQRTPTGIQEVATGLGKFKYEKLPDGTVIQIDPTGRTEPKAVWTAATAPKLDDAGNIYAQVKFGKTTGLSPEQLTEAFNFQMQPSPRDLMDLAIRAEAVRTETGQDLTGQVRALGSRLISTGAVPSAAPVVAPTISPVAAPPAAVAQPVPTPAVSPIAGEPAFVQSSIDNPAVSNPTVPLKLRNELKAAQPKVLNAAIQSVRDIRDLRDTAQKLLNNESGLSQAVGLGGELMAKVKGSAAANAAADLDNLRNRSFTAGLQALRNASPNGSGVGGVTEREGSRFENIQANLSQAQSFDAIRDQLRQLIAVSDESLGLLRNSYETDFGPNKTLSTVFETRVVTEPAKRKSLQQIWGRP